MAKNKKLSENEKSKILALSSEKMSTRQIAKRVGFSQSAVTKFLKHYKSTGRLERKKGSGNVRKTNQAEDRILARISLKNRFKTAVDIRTEFIEAGGSEIGVHTVRRRLREKGLMGRSPSKKPLLTKVMKQKRLLWARKYENWTEIDWRNVIFSDESKFCLFGSEGIQYVRRRKGERFNDECIRPTVKHPAGKMIWGCFSYYGLGEMASIETTVNANVYKKILEEFLVPSLEMHLSKASNCIFQDDSAPCHRAKSVSNYFFNYLRSTANKFIRKSSGNNFVFSVGKGIFRKIGYYCNGLAR